MAELAAITTMDELKDWYSKTQEERNQVVSQTLRDALLDAIREKKIQLEQGV